MRARVLVLILAIGGLGGAVALPVSSRVSAASGEDAFELNERAIELMNSGDLAAAVSLLERAVALQPSHAVLRGNLAEALFRRAADACSRNRYDVARPLLLRAVELEPKRARYPLFLGVCHFHLGALDDAEAALRKSLELDGKQFAAHENLGHVAYERGRSEEAVRAWEKAMAVGSTSAGLAKRIAKVRREIDVEKDFLVARTTHFDVRYDGALGETVLEGVGRQLESAYERVGADLGGYPTESIPVILYSRSGFSEVTDGHRWMAGLFDGRIRIAVDQDIGDGNELGATLAHEYAHYVIHSISPQCPTWLHEGIAQWVERRGIESANARLRRATSVTAMGEASVFDLTESFGRTEDPAVARAQYDQALSFVDWLVGGFGEPLLGRLIRRIAEENGNVRAAVEAVCEMDAAELEASWREARGVR